MNNAPLSPWFSHFAQPQNGHARIFAFPYSGSGASLFFQWAKDLAADPIDLLAVQLPGRETRIRERPLSNLAVVVEQLIPAITPCLDKPFVFFGHSLGALLAFELSRALHERQLPLPQRLFVSAFRAPELPNPNRELHQLPDAGIVEGLRNYAATPEEVLANKQLMAMYLPLLRGDFSLHETYQYQPTPPLPCPITALAGTDDHIAKPDTLLNWQQQTRADFQYIQYQGGHFFLDEHRPHIIKQLKQALS